MPKYSLQHNKKVLISIGRSRLETNWKNREMFWSDLVEKCSTTHRTAETYQEYVAADKDRQSEIKDIGGFVGGHLNGGRRKNGRVINRSLITLDIDFSDGFVWQDFQMLYGCAALIYSTHKHTSDNPRLRLIIPLAEPVSVAEYEAIARRIAEHLNIENFDTTTFQPTRLMYWPSTSRNGEFLFDHQDGPFLNGEEILRTYTDWRDSSQWPMAHREKEGVRSLVNKQASPVEKTGVIGAFCRTYGMQDAIETFLKDEYEPTTDGRFTYKKGSTAAGLVLYDDLFAYSHHGTDPASGVLCNAFDLVRIHKFGVLDEKTEAGTATSKLPSYAAMVDFAGKDPDTIHTLSYERLTAAKETFLYSPEDEQGATEDIEQVEVQDTEWLKQLEGDKNGIKQTIYNVMLILTNDIKLNKCFGYDTFKNRKALLADLPWRKITEDNNYFRDEDEASLRLYMERYYNITSRAAIRDALDTYIFKRAYHPVRDYLDKLEWDGVKRLDTLLIKYMGATDIEYTRAVTRKVLTAAVARIYNPGIKFDYVLTLAGEEGIGKSTLVKKLGGKWFSDTFDTVHGKEAYEQLQGCWLIEIAEMKALKRAEVHAIKSFVSATEDNFRPAYGREKLYVKRQCIFFTTTNEKEFLRGVDGNRRFWVVDCNKELIEKDVLDLDSINEKERAQIWAEAVHLFRNGEKLYLDKATEAVARSIQKKHGEQDERAGIIHEFLDTELPAAWEDMSRYERQAWLDTAEDIREKGKDIREYVCALEIWVEALRLNQRDINSRNTKFLHDTLKMSETWEECGNRRFKHYGVQKAYRRKVVMVEELLGEDLNEIELW